MPVDTNSHYFQNLSRAGQAYLALNWSVIPTQGKVASVPWKSYQRWRVSDATVRGWYFNRRNSGLAIVTGRVSDLAVLDLDSIEIYDAFVRRYPALTETYTVRTRRGYHLYFHIPAQVWTTSRKAPGADWLYEGRYVIAPPTIVDEHEYRTARKGIPRTLSSPDIRCIEQFLATCRTNPVQQRSTATNDTEAHRDKLPGESLTSDDLIALYSHLARQGGRNEALFQASIQVRDGGWTVQAVIAALLDTHARQQPNGHHRPETTEQRYRETIKTIHSAFSRPPRQNPSGGGETSRLPNSVREALLQLKQTSTVRVIEGLYLKGVRPGQHFTYRRALSLLRGTVGQWSIRQALGAKTPDGPLIFDVQNPSPGPPTPAYAAKDPCQWQNTKCLVFSVPKPTRNKRGRLAKRYLMPGKDDLCAKLGVEAASIGDPITENDLQSAKTTRQALHRELIKRRPGLYQRAWLARRLGVSVRTEQRYNRDIPINVRPMYLKTPIFWSNLDNIPDFALPGTFLEDETGKRYPPERGIAVKLLRKRRRVFFARQTVNYYSYGVESAFAALEARLHLQSRKLEAKQRQIKLYNGEKGFERPVTPVQQGRGPQIKRAQELSAAEPPRNPRIAHSQPPSTGPPRSAAKPEQPKQRISKRHYKQPLSDPVLEMLANRVYETLRAMNRDHALALAEARRLADECGREKVDAALDLLSKRRHIRNPAGFLITVLGARRGRKPPPQESQEEWFEKMKNSPYVHFLDNADDFFGY